MGSPGALSARWLSTAKRAAVVLGCAGLAAVRLKYPDAKVDAITVWLSVIAAVVLLMPSDVGALLKFIRRIRVGDNEVEFNALTPEEARRKTQEEIGEATTEGDPSSSGSAQGSETTGSSAGTASAPSSARETAIRLARARGILAVELVLRKLQAEWGIPIQRDVRLGGQGEAVLVDGVATDGRLIRIVEVKFSSSRKSLRLSAENAMQHVIRALRHLRGKGRIKITVAIVVDWTNDLDGVTSVVEPQIQGVDGRVVLKVFSLEDLAREFGVEVA